MERPSIHVSMTVPRVVSD
jgi:hypothetical protein